VNDELAEQLNLYLCDKKRESEKKRERQKERLREKTERDKKRLTEYLFLDTDSN
jgi:hypothetical protein